MKERIITALCLIAVVVPDVKFDEISYADVLTKDLKVMDQTAITLCTDNNIDLCVFNMQEEGNIAKACDGQKIGTTISGGK